MNRFEKRYFINSDGTPDKLIISIDCYQKILYHALCDYSIDYKYAFCDDINLLIEQNDELRFDINTLNLNASLFDVRKYTPNPSEALPLVEKLIDTGTIVAVCTMFDMLPPYAWYKQEDKIGKSNTHFFMIIGYDDKNYYFVDDPGMLVGERMIKYNNNPSVGVLDKSLLLSALQEYCLIITVDVIESMFSYLNFFDIVKNKIVENYYVSNSRIRENNIIGRQALELLNKSVTISKSTVSIISKDYYWIHLMHSRRSIFKWCLEGLVNEYENTSLVLEYLDEDITNWKMLYGVVSRHVYKPHPEIENTINNRVNNIINIEDKLIESIEKMKRK